MVRTRVAGARQAGALTALLAAVSLTVSAQGPSSGAGALDTLLRLAATTVPGTYTVSGQAAQPAATPLPVLVQADVMRGPQRSIRVPVVVGAELTQAAEIRVRVVSAAAAAQTPRIMGNVTGSGGAGPLRFVGEFALAPGDYEIQAVVGPSKAGDSTATLAKSRITVPDVWGGSLAVTPIVLGGDTATAGRGPAQPFDFGPTALIPALKSRFPQDGTLRVAFRIFNWTAGGDGKPDLTVDYLFYERGTKGLHFFNKIKPQRLTEATLGSTFNPAGGAVSSGMGVPLAAFTFGDFQLKVTVTDNRNKQSAEQVVSFTVS